MEFGFNSTGDSIVDAFQQQVEGRTFLITGPSPGGIGAETAITLARGKPSRLVLAGRSEPKIRPVIQEINEKYPDVDVRFIALDLASLSSVRQAATDVRELGGGLDVMILNAAIMAVPFAETVDGFESQFGTDHLGHFLFANLLVDLLPSHSTPESRVVVVASSGHALAEIRFDGKNYSYTTPETYHPVKAYAQAKSANILYTMSLAEKLRPRGISVFSLNPGSIRTNLQTYMKGDVLEEAMRLAAAAPIPIRREFKTLQQGCSTTIRAALDPSLTKFSGSYLHNTVVADDDFRADWTKDKENAENLWKMSETMVGQQFDLA